MGKEFLDTNYDTHISLADGDFVLARTFDNHYHIYIEGQLNEDNYLRVSRTKPSETYKPKPKIYHMGSFKPVTDNHELINIPEELGTHRNHDYTGLSNEDLRNLLDFILVEAPWAKKYIKHYTQASEFFEVYNSFNKKNALGLFLAICVTFPGFADICIDQITTDRFYSDSNIEIFAYDVLQARNVKEICYALCGTYSKDLALWFVNYADECALQDINAISMLRGLAPEKILEILNSGFMRGILDSFAYTGLIDHDSIFVTHFKNLSTEKQVALWKNPKYVCALYQLFKYENIELAQLQPDTPQKMLDEAVLKTGSEMYVFESLYVNNAYVAKFGFLDGENNNLWQEAYENAGANRYTNLPVSVGTLIKIDNLQNLVNTAQKMNICAGAIGYQQRLAINKSVFYYYQDVEQKDYLFEFSTNHALIECRGYKNSAVNDEIRDIVSEAILLNDSIISSISEMKENARLNMSEYEKDKIRKLVKA